jgi:hypothetical protein
MKLQMQMQREALAKLNRHAKRECPIRRRILRQNPGVLAQVWHAKGHKDHKWWFRESQTS